MDTCDYCDGEIRLLDTAEVDPRADRQGDCERCGHVVTYATPEISVPARRAA
jgi:hypothetical protein